MRKPKIDDWRKEIAKKYKTSFVYVVNNNSFEDRGYAATRPRLGYETSPHGGKYTVYSRQTYAQTKK